MTLSAWLVFANRGENLRYRSETMDVLAAAAAQANANAGNAAQQQPNPNAGNAAQQQQGNAAQQRAGKFYAIRGDTPVVYTKWVDAMGAGYLVKQGYGNAAKFTGREDADEWVKGAVNPHTRAIRHAQGPSALVTMFVFVVSPPPTHRPPVLPVNPHHICPRTLP